MAARRTQALTDPPGDRFATVNLTGALSGLEEVESSPETADVCGEAPQALIGMWLLQVRNLRRLIEFHEWRSR